MAEGSRCEYQLFLWSCEVKVNHNEILCLKVNGDKLTKVEKLKDAVFITLKPKFKTRGKNLSLKVVSLNK